MSDMAEGLTDAGIEIEWCTKKPSNARTWKDKKGSRWLYPVFLDKGQLYRLINEWLDSDDSLDAAARLTKMINDRIFKR